jgi:hypothetical protein
MKIKSSPNISLQCSAIKYLSINFHNNMCMNKTLANMCVHMQMTSHNVPSRKSVYTNEKHAGIEKKTDEITNHLKRFFVSHNKFLCDVRRHNKSAFPSFPSSLETCSEHVRKKYWGLEEKVLRFKMFLGLGIICCL